MKHTTVINGYKYELIGCKEADKRVLAGEELIFFMSSSGTLKRVKDILELEALIDMDGVKLFYDLQEAVDFNPNLTVEERRKLL